MYLYLFLNTFSFGITFLLSFSKKTDTLNNLKWIFVSITLAAIPKLIWDIWFTSRGVWGFTEDYLVGLRLLGLPVEEIMFFFAIPYALFFLFFLAKAYHFRFVKFSKRGWYIIALLALTIAFINIGRIYTFVNFLLLSFTALATALAKDDDKKYFLSAYLLSLIPFLLVNGLLTNGLYFVSDQPVVWYNPSEILGIRIIGIPIEDFFYNYNLFFLNYAAYFSLKKRL